MLNVEVIRGDAQKIVSRRGQRCEKEKEEEVMEENEDYCIEQQTFYSKSLGKY